MNSNNHNQARRNSSWHVNSHANNHQRWPNRFSKDYNSREYDNYNRGECSVAPSCSVHGYPKNSQLSPTLRNNHSVHYNNEASGHQHHERRHVPVNNVPDRRHNSSASSQSYQSNGEQRRHMNNNNNNHRTTPPLHINICDTAPTTNLLNNSPPDGVNPRNILDYSQRRQSTDVRVSPVQFPQSQPYYIQSSSDESIKSESPSRKRRRLSRSSHHHHHHHHIDLNAQSSSPPRRSPRQCPPSTSHTHSPIQDRPPIRNPRYRDRMDFPHAHHQPFLIPPPNSPPVAHVHQHQSPLLMTMDQVSVAFPLNPDAHVWGYTPPQFPVCTAPPGTPAHLHSCHVHNMHNVYPGPQLLPQQYAPCLPHQSYGAFPAATSSAMPVTHQPYGHAHQHLTPPRPDNIELDLLADHHHHQVHHGHAHAAALHGTAQPAPLPLPSLQVLNDARNRQLEYLVGRHLRTTRRTQPLTRWSSAPHLITHQGILLHILTMFTNSPISYNQSDLTSMDSVSEPENYEALLNLADQLGEAKPRGLSRLEIEGMLSYRFNLDSHEVDQTSCVICMCDFESRQMIRVLPCAHEFHAKCIDKWLKSNRTCPICRGNAAADYFTSCE